MSELDWPTDTFCDHGADGPDCSSCMAFCDHLPEPRPWPGACGHDLAVRRAPRKVRVTSSFVIDANLIAAGLTSREVPR